MRTVIFPEQSAVAYFFYFMMLIFTVLTLAAYLSIIRKAGFSAWWILLPGTDAALSVILTTLLFFVPTTYTFGNTTFSSPASLDDYEALALMTFVLGVASIIAFFVFAFSTWPIEREVQRLSHRARDAGTDAILQRVRPPAAAPVSAPATTTPEPGATAGGAGTALLTEVPPPAPEAPTTFYCSWCGKERQRGAFAIHHCGSRTRPAVYCSTCGADLKPGAAFCGRCGTDSSTLSPS
ncbi:MAG TPA: zinc ribbon domain-containing protein [Acidimicrobiales bacterium]|nr:zinc ribbon domain-containing protein [Acidimicrobiales bacterium]